MNIVLALCFVLVTIDGIVWTVIHGFWYGVGCMAVNYGIYRLGRWANG